MASFTRGQYNSFVKRFITNEIASTSRD